MDNVKIVQYRVILVKGLLQIAHNVFTLDKDKNYLFVNVMMDFMMMEQLFVNCAQLNAHSVQVLHHVLHAYLILV